ncbi:chloride channel protein [uncultured Dubosiella sp.]|uniref:chloride channel protein n=1 Tax=uncultured Dubosiella sp. TaxID=1937011 RepID=UPI0025CFC55C|nr:chloride channel protein [uncultured Dubosiella sp.]
MKKIIDKMKNILISYEEMIVLSLLGVVIGLIVSLFEVLFGYGLQAMIDLHHKTGNWLLIGLPFAGLFIVYMFQHWGKSAIKGMNLVFEVSQGITRYIPKRLVPFMIGGTWLSNLFGASVGREGVAMQIGATVSHVIGRHFKKYENAKTIFLVCGMAAGFAGLFGTPFTAVFFAMEVLVAGVLKFRAMAPTLTAAFSAAWLSGFFGIYKSSFQLVLYSFEFNWKLIIPLVGLGILFGIVGGAFAWSLSRTKKKMMTWMPDPYKRVLIGGMIAAVLLFVLCSGRYSMLGENLIEDSFQYGTVYWYDWICKFGLTIFCLSVGFMGGEVTPLFAIGATLGFCVSPIFGIPPAMCAALGYAAVFGAGTNTYLASIMIGMEIFGFQYFPLFFIVCSVAYLVNRNKSIYALQQREG